MSPTNERGIYFDLRRTLSYNALFNLILGGRGIGKTYACKDFVLKRYLKSGAQFAYLRRYESETKTTAPTYFNDILKERYPGLDLKYKGDTWTIEGEICGYCLTLSKASTYKSASYHGVETIIFDEFIIEDSGIGAHYLSNEPFKLFDICETVFRMRDNCRLFMLGNAISITNPYFLDWDLEMPRGKTEYLSGDILVQILPPNPDFVDAKEGTRFGRLARRVGYANYSIDNQFYLDKNAVILPKTSAHFLTMVLEYHSKKYGVWCDRSNYIYLFSHDFDAGFPLQFNLDKVDDGHKAFMGVTGRQHPAIGKLRKVLSAGNFGFESHRIRGELKHVLAKLF